MAFLKQMDDAWRAVAAPLVFRAVLMIMEKSD
jgi:hypothetical protein